MILGNGAGSQDPIGPRQLQDSRRRHQGQRSQPKGIGRAQLQNAIASQGSHRPHQARRQNQQAVGLGQLTAQGVLTNEGDRGRSKHRHGHRPQHHRHHQQALNDCPAPQRRRHHGPKHQHRQPHPRHHQGIAAAHAQPRPIAQASNHRLQHRRQAIFQNQHRPIDPRQPHGRQQLG